ncbi:hypothetical protein PG991_008328 [Apiospora marii]|uniref:Uncharacterized protein n=1 Tax=Apiospora marii TaxID=335849 RepID=A0ABR1RQT4_9PEZI
MASLSSVDPMVTFSGFRSPFERSYGPFADLLFDSQRRQCHDMRDKVYALYGLAPCELQKLHPPNYDKHQELVFQETAAYLVRREYSELHGLFDAYGFRDGESPDMLSSYPSWVPNFAADEKEHLQCFRTDYVTEKLTLDGGGSYPPLVSDDLCTLETVAHSLGKVRIVLEFGKTIEAIAAQVVKLMDVERLVHEMGKASGCKVARYTNSYLDQFTQTLSWTRDLAGHQLVVTEYGYIGLCPRHTRNGDLVALIPYLRRPTALREIIQKSPTDKMYKIIGFTYFPELVEGDGHNDIQGATPSSMMGIDKNVEKNKSKMEAAIFAPYASQDRRDINMVVQYFADTYGAENNVPDEPASEKLKAYAVEALEYLEVGDIVQLRRQATAALHYMEYTNT